MDCRRRIHRLAILAPLALSLMSGRATLAADHDDTPELKASSRHDARITDLHVFTRGQDLVITLCSNPAIPKGTSSYTFPSDLSFQINIDRHSEVDFSDPLAVATYGGTVVKPKRIEADIKFEVKFDAKGTPRLRKAGGPKVPSSALKFFAGLRDDPFIRGPRQGLNVATLAIQLPLASVLGRSPTLLVWATSRIDDFEEPIADAGARALRSQFAENLALNDLSPRKQASVLGVVPDVVIFDTSLPAAYPNGRELTDDVVDLVGDARVLSTDAPFPNANDVPFLATFPYLAPPQ